MGTTRHFHIVFDVRVLDLTLSIVSLVTGVCLVNIFISKMGSELIVFGLATISKIIIILIKSTLSENHGLLESPVYRWVIRH